ALPRLLWVAPLTVADTLAVNYALKLSLQALVPSLSRMPQLQAPMVALTIEGTVAAVVVFAALALLARRPIFWFRRIGLAALLISLVPDLALLMGGSAAMWGMGVVGPLISLGMPGPSGPPPGGGPRPGGPPPGGWRCPEWSRPPT